MPGHPSGFSDHFSRNSSAYATFRPRYPAALFTWLAGLPAARRVAWDSGTGSGQAATMLAPHFERVVASDASRAQLRAAQPVPGVRYFAGRGEASSLRSGQVDLVTAAAAYHWFDRDRFHAEVSRILAPGGALAVWCYPGVRISPAIDAELARFYDETVGAYWPPERAHVERGYRLFEIPIEEAPAPAVSIEASFTLAEFLGYVRTWSAVGRYEQANHRDPVVEFGRELEALWGSRPSRQVVFPIAVRAGRWIGGKP